MGTPLYLLHAVTTAAISPFPHSAAVSTPFRLLILPRRVTAAFAPHRSYSSVFPFLFPFVQALLSSISTAVRSAQHFPLPQSFGSKSKSSAGLEIEFEIEIELHRKDTNETEATVDGRKRKGLEEGKGGSARERCGTNGSKKNRKGAGTGTGSAEQSRCASGGGTGVVWWVDGRTPYKN